MVTILDRHVIREMLGPFAIGLGAFTFLAVVDRIYQLTDLVIATGVPIRMVLELLCLMLPSFLTLTLPIALLTATVIAGARLAADGEVLAVIASGTSPLRLFRPVLATSVLVVLAVAVITLVVNPWTYGAIEQQLALILRAQAVSGIQDHTFNTRFPKMVLYATTVGPAGRLEGVLVAHEREAAQHRVIVAREGQLSTSTAGDRVTLRLVEGTIIRHVFSGPPGTGHVDFHTADLELPVESLRTAMTRLESRERDLPVVALFRGAKRRADPAAGTEEAERRRMTAYALELHKRFALPLVALAFVMVGFPLGIRCDRNRPAVNLALCIGLMISYYLLFTALEQMAIRERLPVEIAVWIPNALYGGLGGWLMRRATRAALARALPWPWRGWAARARRGAHANRAAASEGSGLCRRPSRRLPCLSVTDRYLVGQYLKFLAVGLGVTVALFAIIDLIRGLETVAPARPSFSGAVTHAMLRVPGAVHETLPLIVLVATVSLFLSLAKHRELDAWAAGGVSLYRVTLPVLAVAFIVSVGAVLGQETFLPRLKSAAQELEGTIAERERLVGESERSGFWQRTAAGQFLWTEPRDREQVSVRRLTLVEVDSDFRLLSHLEARSARRVSGGWELADGSRWARHDPRPVGFESALVHLGDLPGIHRLESSVRDMGFLELRRHIDGLRRGGYDTTGHAVELYSKLSLPLAQVVMALIAIPCALSCGSRDRWALGAGVAVTVSVAYWVVHAMALSAAKAGLVPSEVAAWTANCVFTGIGAARLLDVRTYT